MLADRIGSMQAQLLKNNKIGSITVTLRGKDIADTKLTDVIKSAVLCGALRELTAIPITYVNAIALAEELGLKVLVNMSEKTEAGSGYMNSMAVELEIEGFLNMSRVIEGTVFGRNELRITKIDGYDIELPPGENMLLFNNYDKPGALLKVASRLATEGRYLSPSQYTHPTTIHEIKTFLTCFMRHHDIPRRTYWHTCWSTINPSYDFHPLPLSQVSIWTMCLWVAKPRAN